MGVVFKAFKDRDNILLLPAFIIASTLTVVIIIGLVIFYSTHDLSPTDQEALLGCEVSDINFSYPVYQSGEIIVETKASNPIDDGFGDQFSTQDFVIESEVETESFNRYLISSDNLASSIYSNINNCPYQVGESIDRYTQSLMTELKSNPLVKSVYPNYISTIFETPNDPYYLDSFPDQISDRDPAWNPEYDYQWNLKKINAQSAWELEGDNEVVVAVIDTGVDIEHPDLSNNIWVNPNEILNGIDDDNNGYVDDINGWNFLTDSKDVNDDNGHGTAVSGIIAAETDNQIGIAGLSTKTKIMVIKAFDSYGNGNSYNIFQALEYAIDNGADVINSSYGAFGDGDFFKEIYLEAFDKNIVSVAAAGNQSANAGDYYPANITCADAQNPTRDCVLTVGAVDQDDDIPNYSNLGSALDITAPGGAGDYNIITLNSKVFASYRTPFVIADRYIRLSGTSHAAPHVSGLAGMILSKNPELTNSDVSNIILNGSTDLGEEGFDNRYGFGRLDLYKSLNEMNTAQPTQIRAINPSDGMVTGNEFWLRGSNIAEGFESYKVEIKKKGTTEWTSVGITVSNPNKLVRLGELAKVRITGVNEITKYDLRISVTTTNGVLTSESSFTMNPTVANNYPINLSNYNNKEFTNYPQIADIDQDGKSEIIVYNSNEHKLYAYDHEGKIKYGWPNQILEDSDRPAPVVPIVLDFDQGSPGLETFVLIKQNSGKLLGFNANGTQTFNFRTNSPINRSNLGWIEGVGSLTAGKYNQENVIVFAETNSNKNEPYLHAINQYSQELNGFPIELTKDALDLPLVVTNLDYDDDSEIVIQQNNNILVFDLDGQKLSEVSAVQDSVSSSITALSSGDLNADGRNEIIVATIENGVRKINVLDQNSNPINNEWPVTIDSSEDPISSIQVVNFDLDESVELIVSDSENSYMLDNTGEEIKSYDFPFSENTSSVISNNSTLFYSGLNNTLDYLVLQNNTKSLINYNSIDFPNKLGFPSIYDLDNDGKSELIFNVLDSNNNQFLYKFNLNQEFSKYNWPLYLYNTKHTNALESNISIPTTPPTITPSLQPTVIDTPKVTASTPPNVVAKRCMGKIAYNPSSNQLMTSVKAGQEFEYVIDFNAKANVSGVLTDYLPEGIEVIEYDTNICSDSTQVLGIFSGRDNSRLNAVIIGLLGIVLLCCTLWLLKKIDHHGPERHHRRVILVILGFFISITIIEIFFLRMNSDNSPEEGSASLQNILTCEISPGMRTLRIKVKASKDAIGNLKNVATLSSNGESTSCENNLVVLEPTPTSSIGGVACGPIDIDSNLTLDIIDFAGSEGGFSKKYYKNCIDEEVVYEGCGPKDVNRDGKLDIVDFAGSNGFAKRYRSSDCRF